MPYSFNTPSRHPLSIPLLNQYSHKHGPEFNEVAVIRVLNLYDAPRVHTPSHFASFDFDYLAWTNHSKWDGGLLKENNYAGSSHQNFEFLLFCTIILHIFNIIFVYRRDGLIYDRLMFNIF